MSTSTVTVAGLKVSIEVMRTLEQTVLSTEEAIREDLELLRSGKRSEEATLAYCLDGVDDPKTEAAWREYVAVLVAEANRR